MNCTKLHWIWNYFDTSQKNWKNTWKTCYKCGFQRGK